MANPPVPRHSRGLFLASFRSSRGFSLVELLYALALMVIFMLIATHLFNGSLKTMQRTSEAANAAAGFDAAVRALRQDIAAATAVDVANEHYLVAHSTAGDISWDFSASGILTRKNAEHEQRWDVQFALQISRDGAIVLLREKDAGLENAIAMARSTVQ